jgi:hypothetical protein
MSDRISAAPQSPVNAHEREWQDAYSICLDLATCVGNLLDAAGYVLGESVDPLYCIPAEERDDNSPGLTYTPLDVLGHLAAVWIICREPGIRARLVTAACEQLKQKRAQQSASLVRIVPISAASTAKALWDAGKLLSDGKQGFGCARLAEIVKQVFPDGLEHDPSSILGALLFWNNPAVADPEALIDAERQLYEQIQRQPSHLTRLIHRFRGFGLRDAIAAARVPPLAQWLRKVFQGFNARDIRRELELEFAVLPQQAKQPTSETLEPEGQADNGADSEEKNQKILPDNPLVLKLANRINREQKAKGTGKESK